MCRSLEAGWVGDRLGRAAAGGGPDVFCWAVGLAAAVPGWDDGRQGAPIHFSIFRKIDKFFYF